MQDTTPTLIHTNSDDCTCYGCSLPFANLHNHTTLGSEDSIIKPDEFAETISHLGQEYVVQTEHGTMCGMVKVAKAAKKRGLKYIPGIEAYVCFNGLEKAKDELNRNYYHMLLLAKNNRGLRNLFEIVRRSHQEDHRYYKPRIEFSELRELGEGLVATSGCIASRSSQLILADRIDKAMEHLHEMLDLFGSDFYIEVQDSGAGPDQDLVNRVMIDAAKELSIGLVATSDAHFARDGQQEAHTHYKRIRTGVSAPDEGGDYHESGRLYLKTGQELAELFGREAISNTVHIAEQCDVDLQLGRTLFPVPDIPESFLKRDGRRDPDQSEAGAYLSHLAHQGLHARGLFERDGYLNRLRYELQTIEELGFSPYFLIIKELLGWCDENDIPYGPGRGSAAGSMVCYALRITDVDPIEYGLFFSRFLNKSRVSWPDIDLDFCQERRDEVIAHLIEKYGESHACQIITYGTLRGKSAARDIGRVIGDTATGNAVADLMPPAMDGHHISIEEAVEESKALRHPRFKDFIEKMLPLEGLTRNTGIHAAGVVISPVPLAEIGPVGMYNKGGKNLIPAVQLDMQEVEDLGLVKMDILGLRTLTIIYNTLRRVSLGHPSASIPLDDPHVMDSLAITPDFGGYFQLENTAGIYWLTQQVGPKNLSHIGDIVATFRPGPLRTGMAERYVQNRANGWQPDLNNPLDVITKDTNGCLIYQEQVIQLCVQIAGFSEEDGDRIRKVLGKKKPEEVEQWREPFIEGCAKTSQLDREQALELFQTVAEGAAYLFNKSHAISYGLLTYWCAWLRYYYRDAFLAECLNASADKKEKRIPLVKTCQSLGVPLLPPRLSTLHVQCQPVEGGGISIGTALCRSLKSGVKGVIKAASNPEPASLKDFLERVDRRSFNKTKIMALAKTGALDELANKDGLTRTGLVEALEYMYQWFKDCETKREQLRKWHERKQRRAEQEALKAEGKDYGGKLIPVRDEPVIPELDLSPYQGVPRDPYREALWEFEVMATCISAYPLRYIPRHRDDVPISEMRDVVNRRKRFFVVGIVSNFKELTNRKKKRYARFTLEDETCVAHVTCFFKSYEKLQSMGKLEDGTVIRARVSVMEERDEAGGENDLLELSVHQYDRVEPNIQYKRDVEAGVFNDAPSLTPSPPPPPPQIAHKMAPSKPLRSTEASGADSNRTRLVHNIGDFIKGLHSAPPHSHLQYGRVKVSFGAQGGRSICQIRWPQS